MRQKIAFHHCNPNKPHRYGLLLKSLNDARFPYIQSCTVCYKTKAGHVPYYLKSTIDLIKYLVTEMEADQSTTGRTISTDRLYTSTESTNWFLHPGIAVVGILHHHIIPSEFLDTQNIGILSATYHFEKEKKNICLTSYAVKTKSKGKTNVVLSTSRPLHGKTIDDGKEKAQKAGTDMVDQLNDYYTTRSKSCRWIMIALSYMLNTARVNGKTVWCLKNDSDISSTFSYDFGWNLAKALAFPHVQRTSLNDLASRVQLKIKMFLRTALLVDEPVPKVESRFTGI